ncbi:MAG: hypothetical protein M3P43_07410 [Actinomycetota bacterium]|nr:hypothetical protein [Actinomycetota bacterium]
MIARRAPVRLAALVAALALLAVACRGSDRPPEDGEPVTITLLTHDSFDVSASVLRAFERQSGIRVRVLPAGDAGQVVNRAILAAGNPEATSCSGSTTTCWPTRSSTTCSCRTRRRGFRWSTTRSSWTTSTASRRSTTARSA